ncbi:MAG: ATP-binding protein, partial [Pirellulales bacterium]
GIEFCYKPSLQLPLAVHGDERALRQVLLNLLGNAIKFTDQGTVTFTVQYGAAASGASHFRFIVEDTGIGIPADRLEDIFVPFQQVNHADRSDEGTGLGLAISRNLIELMDSTIKVDSTPGKGSVVSFELVLPVTVAMHLATGDQNIIGYEGKRRRILVVDDTEVNRAVLVGLLTPLGFELAEAENGSEAVTATRDWNPDVVLMDLVMPVMDGFEATRTIQNFSDKGSPIIIALSASVLQSDQQQSANAGCDDFIPKPVQAQVILDKLQLHLGLNWIYQSDNEVDSDAAAFGNLKAPPLDDLESLQQLAKMGDIQGVHRSLEAIASKDEALLPFVGEIRGKADRFELRGVTKILDRFISEAKGL